MSLAHRASRVIVESSVSCGSRSTEPVEPSTTATALLLLGVSYKSKLFDLCESIPAVLAVGTAFEGFSPALRWGTLGPCSCLACAGVPAHRDVHNIKPPRYKGGPLRGQYWRMLQVQSTSGRRVPPHVQQLPVLGHHVVSSSHPSLKPAMTVSLPEPPLA